MGARHNVVTREPGDELRLPALALASREKSLAFRTPAQDTLLGVVVPIQPRRIGPQPHPISIEVFGRASAVHSGPEWMRALAAIVPGRSTRANLCAK